MYARLSPHEEWGGSAEKKLSKLALLRSSNVGASGLFVSPLSRGTGKIYTIYGKNLSLFAPCDIFTSFIRGWPHGKDVNRFDVQTQS